MKDEQDAVQDAGGDNNNQFRSVDELVKMCIPDGGIRNQESGWGW